MKQSIRSLLLSVLVVLTATLTACDTVLEVGVEPTVTPTPTPPVTPTPSPTTGRLPTVAPTAVPTATSTATRTTVPTAITEPSATPEPTPTPRTSEIIFLDETWHQYTNYQLGFSLKVPNRMLSFRGACKWNEKDGDRSFRYDPALVPVRIFEDVDSVYIAPEYLHELSGEWKQANGRTCFTECSQVPNSLALLQDPEKPWFSAEMWKIVAAAVHSDDELDAFIKARYGSGCSIREKEASGQDGVYRVRVQGDGKDLPETQCPLNYATVVKYYPEGNRVFAWDLGQAYTFVGAVDYSVAYDQEMVESFRFLIETLAVAPSTIVEQGLVTYADDEHGFSFQYPASWTLTELPERKMDTGRCADTVVLSQDTLAITIQYLHPSQCCEQVAWCGVAWILEPTFRDEVTIMGHEASRTMLTYLEEPKAVDISYVDEDVDLGLLITLRDTSTQGSTASEMATIPAPALAELEQILASFEHK